MADSPATLDLNLPSFPTHLPRSNADAEAPEIQTIIDQDYALLAAPGVAAEEEREHSHQGLASLSVVWHLPFDILGQIFFHFCEQSHHVWLLGHVCRQWKATTLALPGLWANIERRFPPFVMDTHLENSKASPLTIDLGVTERSALARVVQHSERWETVKLEMGPRMSGILERVHRRLPLLRRVVYRDSDHHTKPCRAFEVAPRLSEASIRSRIPVLLPWAQLRRLSLRDHLEPLQSTTNLVELTLATYFLGPVPILETPVLLPRLRRLFVREGKLLRSLECPALEDLFVSHDAMLALPFIYRCGCPLSIFTSACPTFAYDGLTSLFDLVSTILVELRLLGYDPDLKTLLQYLYAPPDDDALSPSVPALRTVSQSVS